ncbi:MAG TPA: DMT family transporter [Steroidobacteraceae bacterium]|nr:DMT family transporter [Steroidobacteraceae bacterium]
MRERRLQAIATMITAVAVFSFMDGVLKFFAMRYPPLEVAALRGATSLPFTLAPVLIAGRWRALIPRRWPMHLLRGTLSVVVIGGFVLAVRSLSLANAYSVFLSAPLLVAAFSVPLLRERLDWRNWLAILVGLGGVLVMLRPSAAGLASLGALAALAGATAYALSGIAVRILTRTDTTVSVVFWTISLMTLFTSLMAAPGWVPIAPEHLKWLLALGVLAAIGQYLLTEAFRSAPPSVVSPFEYTALLWGVGIDRVVWQVLPSARVCLGGGVVIASGLYLIWRERAALPHAQPQQSWQ